MKINLLKQIPIQLSNIILTEWIDVYDVCLIDHSYCNKDNKRSYFYNSISKDTILGILEIQLKNLSIRARDKGLELTYTQDLKNHLVGMGYDSEYGARPLKRLIQKEVGNALSEFILKGDYLQGQKITLDYKMEKVLVI